MLTITGQTRIDAMCHRNAAVLLVLLHVFLAPHSQTVATAQETKDADSSKSTEVKNLFRRPEDIAEGRMYVRGYCSICHGLDGAGGRAPALTRPRFRHGNSDDSIFRNIRNGIPGTGMSGFGWADKRIWQVVSFIRAQRSSQEPPVLTGDANRGRRLFEQHKCAACHWTGRQGGHRGPDLSTSRSTLEYVRTAIVNPSADIDRRYQQLVIIRQDGRVLQGMRLSENSYYVQLIDEKDNLHTISKADIEELRRPNQSLMQSYEKVLTIKELDDLIAYVFALRKE